VVLAEEPLMVKSIIFIFIFSRIRRGNRKIMC
jgi:hypothetical protein